MGNRQLSAIECECQRLVRAHGMGVAVGPGENPCNDIMELILELIWEHLRAMVSTRPISFLFFFLPRLVASALLHDTG